SSSGVPLLFGGGEEISPARESLIKALQRRSHNGVAVVLTSSVPGGEIESDIVYHQIQDAPDPFVRHLRDTCVLHRCDDLGLDRTGRVAENEQLRNAGIERLLDAGEPNCQQVTVDQVAIRKIEQRGSHLAVHHCLGVSEKVLIVWTLCGGVGDDQCGLSATASASASLRVVCGRGR